MKKFVIALVVVAILVATWVLWPKSGMTVTIPARPTVRVPMMQAGEINMAWWATVQTGVIMLLLFVGVVVRPAWFKFSSGDTHVITFKRVIGAIVTLCVGGMIWFGISSSVTAPIERAIEDGRIQIGAINGYTLIVPQDATVAAESAGELTLTGPVTIVAADGEPRMGWPTGAKYFTIPSQPIPAGEYGISGVKHLDTGVTVNIIEIRDVPVVFLQNTPGQRFFLVALLALLQALLSYMAVNLWLSPSSNE